MNAKETLKKLAEALGVVSENENVTESIETTQEEVQSTPEVENVEETVNEVIEEPKEEASVTETEEVNEPVQAEETVKEDTEVNALKEEIENLKKILKAAIEEESKPEVVIPTEQTKPLTHSPEKKMAPKAQGIGQKGASIQERVYKYINGVN